MDYCLHGDLNMFCGGTELNINQKLDIMNGIARGIEYLHSNNVIHRDIKPANILIADVSPLVAKLADFDVSKCLDENVETSVMSSSVGTFAFKAPEFFQRHKGKLSYHRNVDVYASGLTFLAMIQAEGNRKLVPRIETPRDDSECYAPSIGALIAERIKYNVPELNIVLFDQTLPAVAITDNWLENEV